MTDNKIIIVDDDIAARLALKAELEQAGYDVLQADSGVRLLAMLLIEEPDVVLLETRMRLIDTFEVCRVLRDSSQLTRSRIVFMGGQPTGDELRQIRELGDVDFLPKPVDATALIGLLRAPSPSAGLPPSYAVA